MIGREASGAPPLLGQGSRIADRYVVVRPLGEGGMGQVFEVEHEAIGRHFALKVLNINPCTEETLRRFRREARALGRVSTPRVAQVTDFGVESKLGPFYVMELLDGETLEDRLERVHHLNANEAIPIAIDLCEALAEVHEAGIIHRDLKPSNVGLTRTGPVRVKLLDFGLAAAMDGAALERITRSQEVVGSLPYMAPERFHNSTLTYSIDLYALGVVFYEMLTGDLPFNGNSAALMINQHLNEPPRPFSQAAPDIPIPASLEAIVARLLDKQPEQRFMSAAAVARALQAATVDAPVLPTLAEVRDEVSVAATVLAESSAELPVQPGAAMAGAGSNAGPQQPALAPTLDSRHPPAPINATSPSTPTPPASIAPTAFAPEGAPATWPQSASHPSASPSAYPSNAPPAYAGVGSGAVAPGYLPEGQAIQQSWVSGPIPPTTLKPALQGRPSGGSRSLIRIVAIAAAGLVGSMLAAVLAVVVIGSGDSADDEVERPQPQVQGTAPVPSPPSYQPVPPRGVETVIPAAVEPPHQNSAVLPPVSPLPLPSIPDAGASPAASETDPGADVPPDAGMSVTPTKRPVSPTPQPRRIGPRRPDRPPVHHRPRPRSDRPWQGEVIEHR